MNYPLCALTALATGLAACSMTPTSNASLEQARNRYQVAQQDSQVVSQAPDEFEQAGQALQMAENAHSDDAGKDTVDHLAYMASQRVTIAQETAGSKLDQMVTANAASRRDKMRLAVRTVEADKAAEQLVASQQRNAQKVADLATANAETRRSEVRVSELEAELQSMSARRTDRGIVVTLGDVLFDTGKSRILRDDDGRMTKLADFFRQHPSRNATIEGYTDNVGSEISNIDLSRRRAEAVVDSLVSKGVPADRLSTRANGEADPAASNSTAAGRQMNRRVEVVFAHSPEETSSK